jgi:hypothetical protein|tara:strand:- start:891 stop:1151 length:261 start_codon:yes stop_codon:yes gene_type:complete
LGKGVKDARFARKVNMENLELFDIAPKEKTGEIQKTEIEYITMAFEAGKKKQMIKMLEHLCDEGNFKAYADYLFLIIKGIYEKNNS